MTESYSYLLVKGILTLVFVLGLMGAVLYALRFYLNRGHGSKKSRPGSPVRLLNTFFLGQKRNLAIVEVAGEVMVLGVTPGSITLVARIDNPEAAEELKKMDSSKALPFLTMFKGGL